MQKGEYKISNIRSIYVFLTFVYQMLKNKHKLNDDLLNNYLACKDFCIKTIKASKINLIVEGKDNIPVNGPTLIASNHKSFFDIILLISVIDRAMPFVAAKELNDIPILKDYINGIKCVLIDREENDFNKLKEEINNIDKAITNTGLIIFPEGECSYNKDEIKEFKKGGFMGSKKDITIVPTFIDIKKFNNIASWYVPEGDVKITFGEGFVPKKVINGRIMPSTIAKYTKNKVLELKNKG